METWIVQMIRTRLVRRVTAWALALGCVIFFAVTEHTDISELLIIAVPLFGFLKCGFSARKFNRDPSSNPVVSRVISWGDPIGIAHEAQREADSPRHKGGGWLVTDHYLIQSSFFKYDLLRFSDLLWSYESVTKHSINFIPTGNTYEAVLICYGGSASIKGSKKAVDAILTFAAERAPWAVFGFSKELEKLFRKNTEDFCAAVEQRRHDWAQQVGNQSKA